MRFNFKTGDEILIENPYGGGCDSIYILQNWRGILKVSEKSTSGSRASDVWSNEEKYQITSEKMYERLEDELIYPYGWKVTIIKNNGLENYYY